MKPVLAQGDTAQAILAWLQPLSEPFGTQITIDGDVGVIRPSSALELCQARATRRRSGKCQARPRLPAAEVVCIAGSAGGRKGSGNRSSKHLTEKILASRSALEGERKQVTVCFADIKDSTELIKDLDPQAAQQLLAPAIHIMLGAVHRFEGAVNQVLSDGILRHCV